MSGIYTLTLFFCRTLFRSLTGAVPPLLTLVFYFVTFHLFPFDADYLISVGGFQMVLVCIVTTFLLTDKINRAATYPFLQRLPHRSDLLVANVLGSLLITGVLAIIFALVATLRHLIFLNPIEWLHLIIRWTVLCSFTSVLTLHVTHLVARNYSHLITYFVLAILVTISEQKRVLIERDLGWLVEGVEWLVSPIKTTLSGAISLPLPEYFQPLVFTLMYTTLLSGFAAWLFRRKDVIWME